MFCVEFFEASQDVLGDDIVYGEPNWKTAFVHRWNMKNICKGLTDKVAYSYIWSFHVNETSNVLRKSKHT